MSSAAHDSVSNHRVRDQSCGNTSKIGGINRVSLAKNSSASSQKTTMICAKVLFLSLGIIFIELILMQDNNLVECKPTAARKPPFNGSIFGKRSTLPAAAPLQAPYSVPIEGGGQLWDLNQHNDYLVYQETFAQQQHEMILKRALNKCLLRGDQINSTVESMDLVTVCEAFLIILRLAEEAELQAA